MRMSPAYETAVRDATRAVRMAAERADQARDTEALLSALSAVRDATIKAAFVVREADEVTRAEADRIRLAEAMKPYTQTLAA